jgi:hypothetical protein
MICLLFKMLLSKKFCGIGMHVGTIISLVLGQSFWKLTFVPWTVIEFGQNIGIVDFCEWFCWLI